MAFIRTRTVNGRKYRSLEERYREGGKVKSRYIRSLGADGFDRHLHGHAGEFADMKQGYDQLQAREKAAAAPAPAAAEAPASEAPAADAGHENAASGSEGGKS